MLTTLFILCITFQTKSSSSLCFRHKSEHNLERFLFALVFVVAVVGCAVNDVAVADSFILVSSLSCVVVVDDIGSSSHVLGCCFTEVLSSFPPPFCPVRLLLWYMDLDKRLRTAFERALDFRKLLNRGLRSCVGVVCCSLCSLLCWQFNVVTVNSISSMPSELAAGKRIYCEHEYKVFIR